MPKVGMQPIRRQQLIEAALAAINDVGMHDASIVQIARRAGVSNGIISHYFRDKNGLLEATMRYLISHLGLAVKSRLLNLAENTPRARLRAIVQGNFDDSQTNSAAMKTWLAFWASSLHSPMLRRLQQVNDRRLYSNLCVEFSRCLSKDNARIAAKGLAGLIDGLWLRGALSHEAFNREEALSITYEYIDQQLART
ncbi:transcriptional regulator BetI [Pectobacterium odoriferum]|uniref:HTH-type transcriptional regulator BetI n=1 Tax=Pectobacterium odoriferum TaxID=78398 RepID=A0ABD6VL41_9GAMM|nr:transcriptional regulator BetI [Pectobacterium odoriferum]POD93203.1 transcriptional regulator BetI [Pectobacterium odoriferum]POE10252.1 transcriptional regulator BetI [Pectobacterium odoriferum]POE21079.1 transcriptional regulator BetI [Pectobacterium odoriferum]POE24833.1 transcriptional regulator BetI [Pectobacterium odoriferum]POE29472.1 transcriptional regulator BetI [Pectobacterium odoriferum]